MLQTEKKIYTDIVANIIADSYEILDPAKDEITLVAGDGDYVPAIQLLKLKKPAIQFHVVFWNHASRELKDACTKFISLDPYLEHLNRDT
jgi:uncharacterized LabA/DUF88 family protein